MTTLRELLRLLCNACGAQEDVRDAAGLRLCVGCRAVAERLDRDEGPAGRVLTLLRIRRELGT